MLTKNAIYNSGFHFANTCEQFLITDISCAITITIYLLVNTVSRLMHEDVVISGNCLSGKEAFINFMLFPLVLFVRKY